jgi:uncharacterized YigZ family protein
MPDAVIDSYWTLSAPSEGLYKEKMSKFLAFAHPCRTAEEALDIVASYRKEYYDARHVCWAYMLGVARTNFRSNDDGEPSGTAGKPILGQINSRGLSDLVIIVVRYFGGIKLGTSGLIEAYRAAAAEALDAAQLEERLVEEQVTASLDYALMGDVMRIVKEEGATLLSQEYGEKYRLTLSLRRAGIPRLKARLSLIYGVTVEEPDEENNKGNDE